MPTDKEFKKKAEELEDIYKQMIKSYRIEDFYPHFYAELSVAKTIYQRNLPYAMSAEKIAALEKAVEEFKMVYDAEKAEAEKMPLSWHEAQRVLRLFDEAHDRFSAPPAERIEN